MAPHVYLEALNRALNAELLQWGGSDSTGGGRRRGRAIAALLFGATTVVGATVARSIWEVIYQATSVGLPAP